MHLSAKQFAEIVERLEADAAGVPAGDNRRAPRVALANRATIIPYVGGVAGKGVGVEVRDFSARGIRFLHSAKFTRGEQFVLELLQQGAEPVSILCTIVHCKPTDEGPFSTGAEFTCVLRNVKAGAADRQERDRIRQSILD
jgi:hypothetical protein